MTRKNIVRIIWAILFLAVVFIAWDIYKDKNSKTITLSPEQQNPVAIQQTQYDSMVVQLSECQPGEFLVLSLINNDTITVQIFMNDKTTIGHKNSKGLRNHGRIKNEASRVIQIIKFDNPIWCSTAIEFCKK